MEKPADSVVAAVKPPKKKSPPKKKKAALATGAMPPRRGRLEDSEIAGARAVNHLWDRRLHYGPGSLFVHAKFGVGYVLETKPDMIVCLFEDGTTRTLIHGRS